MTRVSVSIIGSFRKHYDDVVKAVRDFEACGIIVKSPPLSVVVNPGADFPRFESDDPAMSSRTIQELTMKKILSSDIVYTVAPLGYVGRTTCYEIGAIRERGVPLYFSDRPKDLPIHVPSDMIMKARDLAFAVSGVIGTTS